MQNRRAPSYDFYSLASAIVERSASHLIVTPPWANQRRQTTPSYSRVVFEVDDTLRRWNLSLLFLQIVDNPQPQHTLLYEETVVTQLLPSALSHAQLNPTPIVLHLQQRPAGLHVSRSPVPARRSSKGFAAQPLCFCRHTALRHRRGWRCTASTTSRNEDS